MGHYEESITDEQIRSLRDEAGEAGDLAMVTICDHALNGDLDARMECAYVIGAK